ncbi:hypothetical protein SBY92_002628 [Candida maltosa Xu316]|uniref:Alpha/beta hydrolase fold-3 domain-containing protein n=1 Tax=Candida maltosa (strain Xu316) TaxID=1245528 RepID=M3JU87_CANMX|nr:hypothetical protein G210_3317 [Candida maltosa Xu316]
MISLKTIYIILTIPFKLAWVAIKYPFVGGINDKFRNNLTNSLKLTIFRQALRYPIEDKGKLSLFNNEYLVNNLIKKWYPNLTDLNNYGKRYDEHSFWIVEAENRTNDDPIIIYAHGGCFVFESAPSQIETLLSTYYLVDPSIRARLSILFLDYKLASQGYPVPYQLHELTESYKKLVDEGSQNIILMGDSAGGNLALTFLQQIKSNTTDYDLPYPKSAVLISPWVKLKPDDKDYEKGHSMHDNSSKDMLQDVHFQQIFTEGGLILGNVNSLTVSPGNCAYSCEDWTDIPTLDYTFVIYGEHETFRDDIAEWCEYALKTPKIDWTEDSKGVLNSSVHEYVKKEAGKSNVSVFVEPWGIHDAVMMFESDVVAKIKNNPDFTLDDVDQEKYFGMYRLVTYLNEILSEN